VDQETAEAMARWQSRQGQQASRTGIHRTGRRTRVLLGEPIDPEAVAHLQVFTWFTEGRDWVRIEIRHVTDAGTIIQTAVDDTEMDPGTALAMATDLAARYRIGLVYFQDALPARRAPRQPAACDWQVCIR
jgi:hypothetical protein